MKEAADIIKNDFTKSLLVEASAGTGKTTSLVSRMVNAFLLGKAKPEKTVAITFTNRAAEELKSRVLQNLFEKQAKLEGEERRKIDRIILEIGNVQISTIHSFYQHMLSQKPAEAKLDTSIRILEEESEEYDRLWKKFQDNDYEGKEDLIFAVEVLGIGAGSFRDFCRKRIDYPELNLSFPQQKITKEKMFEECVFRFNKFTEWAAGSMRKCNNPDDDPYCRRLGHIIEEWKAMAGYEMEHKISYIMHLKKMPEPKCRENWNKLGKRYIGKIEKEEAESKLKNIKEIIIQFLFGAACKIAEEFLGFFNDYSSKHSIITFQDSLMRARNLMRNDPEVREYFRRQYDLVLVDEFQDTDPVQAEVIAWLCSDNEEDDWKMLNLVPGKLFAVGDPKQSIFRFRRADISIYEEFKTMFKKEEILTLEKNYRSSRKVAELVNSYFKKEIRLTDDFSSPDYSPIIPARKQEGKVVLLDMKLFNEQEKQQNPELFNRGKLKAQYLKEREPSGIAWWIKNKIIGSEDFAVEDMETGELRKPRPEDIMVLFRNKANIDKWADAFESFGLPVENISGEGFFKREEVRDGISLLRAVAFPSESASFYGAVKSPLFSVSDKEIYQLKREWGYVGYLGEKSVSDDCPSMKKAVEVFRSISSQKLKIPDAHIARYILERTGAIYLWAYILNNKQAALSLIKLASITEQIVKTENLDFPSAMNRISEMAEEGVGAEMYLEEEVPSGIRLMTIHKAKGMESPIVITGDMSKTEYIRTDRYVDRANSILHMPFQCSFIETNNSWNSDFCAEPQDWEKYKEIEDDFQIQEEKRLRYVSCTRAREYLIVTNSHELSNKVYYRGIIEHLKKNDFRTEKTFNYAELSNEENTEIKIIAPYKKGLEEYVNEFEKKLESFKIPVFTKTLPSKIENYEKKEHEGYGAEHGIKIHEILQMLIEAENFNPNIEKIAKNKIERKHLTAAVENDIWRRVAMSEKRYAEFQIGYFNDEKQELIHGEIDLIFKEGNKWVIVDYKTNKIESKEEQEELKKFYSRQLDYYKKTFEKVTGEKVKELKLLFLDAD